MNDMNELHIDGRWEILRWEQVYDDGRIVHPMGVQLEGFIEYGPHGMFCAVGRKDRKHFRTGGQWSADDTEKAAAYDSYLTYAGDYEVNGREVTHKVRHSLFPNWVGGVQRRMAELEGDILSLTARLEEGTAEARTARLVWRRA